MEDAPAHKARLKIELDRGVTERRTHLRKIEWWKGINNNSRDSNGTEPPWSGWIETTGYALTLFEAWYVVLGSTHHSKIANDSTLCAQDIIH